MWQRTALQDSSSSKRSSTWGIIETKIHLTGTGCLQHHIALITFCYLKNKQPYQQGAFVAQWQCAGLLVNRWRNQSCTRGMIHNKNHLISQGCLRPIQPYSAKLWPKTPCISFQPYQCTQLNKSCKTWSWFTLHMPHSASLTMCTPECLCPHINTLTYSIHKTHNAPIPVSQCTPVYPSTHEHWQPFMPS